MARSNTCYSAANIKICSSFLPQFWPLTWFTRLETIQYTVNENTKYRTNNPINPYPTAFPYGNGMVLHFYQQQESSTTKTVHKVINKGLKTYV